MKGEEDLLAHHPFLFRFKLFVIFDNFHQLSVFLFDAIELLFSLGDVPLEYFDITMVILCEIIQSCQCPGKLTLHVAT